MPFAHKNNVIIIIITTRWTRDVYTRVSLGRIKQQRQNDFAENGDSLPRLLGHVDSKKHACTFSAVLENVAVYATTFNSVK